jgi:Na+-translocating ferredoxin:NAD+ oxidoreductase RnfD subunit
MDSPVLSVSILALVSIVLGLVIDSFFKKLSNRVNTKARKTMVAILQIVFLAYVTTVVPNWFTKFCCSTFSGILAPSLFFGLQSNIFNTIKILAS